MIRSTLILTIVIVTAAGAASAGTFTVTLTNGTTFETRYRPVTADWDEDLVLLATDRGNRIALRKDEIAAVVSSVEESGFGYQVDTTTLYLGWSPQDQLEEGEGDGSGAGADSQNQAFAPEPTTFTIQQFVNPDSTGGIELPSYVGNPP